MNGAQIWTLKKARFNMVEQQIRPWDVLDFDILDALKEIGRGAFRWRAFQDLAYADMELPLANGHKMLEPMSLPAWLKV